MRAEKCLNNFVRFIALLERVGNGIGTLAFIWGTVVVLGGFSTYLANDFWVSTVIVFMEGFRAFSRQSRSDDQFLFKTTRGIKLKRMELGSGILYYMNAAMMTACMWLLTDSIIDAVIILHGFPGFEIFMLLVLLVIIHELGFYTLIGYMSSKESHTLLQLCPGATLLITGLSLYYTKFVGPYDWVDYSFIPLWFSIYILARFGSPGDNCPFHGKVKVAARLLRVACIVAVICGMAHWFQYIPHWFQYIPLLMMFVSSGLGNLQTPMALARILLSAVWLFLNPIEVVGAPNENIKLAVKFLYIMVMCQGILYLAACMLESLSFLFRRSLALDCDLVDKSGMKSINLYYEQAYDTFLEENLFDTTKKMGLVTFAVDSLNPEASRDKKHAAVRILDSFLQKHKTSSSHTELISRITTSTKAVTTLINMLGWTVTEDADMRLFAAKVIAHISPYLQILGFPGAMQKVSSLLDGHAEPMTQEISAQLLDDFGSNADDQQISDGASSTMNGSRRDIVDRQQTRNGTSNSQLDIEEGRAPGVQGCSLVCKFFLPLMEWKRTFKQHFKDLQSIPHEDSKDKDTLPALGMQILEGLAHDLHNCEEISRAKELLPKIIGFISCMTGKKATQQGEITTSSLILVEKLASVKGEIGMTLQKELSGNLMLISNLAEILEFEGSSSYPEQSRLAMHIIAKIATHKKTRLKIGTNQVIIGKLVQGFIGEDESSKPLRAEAGEALTTLAMECPANCYAMLNKTNCEFIGDLASKLQRDQHIYQAASLLHSLCENCRQLVLSHQGSKDWLLSILTVVLGRIVDAEGKQMKALIGLASQICSIMSGGIDPIMESFPNDKELVKKLVGELNAHKKPSPDEFSDMRRWLIELTVSIVESCPRYALIFRQHRMVEALSKVEQYMGLAFSEEAEALPAMVARAKELIGANTP